MEHELAEPRAPQCGLEDTVRDLAPRLLRFALGRCGDRSLAEEVSQDTLLALVDRWRRLGPPEMPPAFAFSVLRRRLARRQLRQRAGRALAVPLDRLRQAFGFEPAGEDDPTRRAEIREELRSTLEHLQALSPRLRDALLLVAGAGLDTRSAARVLGISPSALKMRVSRARDELREMSFSRRSTEDPPPRATHRSREESHDG